MSDYEFCTIVAGTDEAIDIKSLRAMVAEKCAYSCHPNALASPSKAHPDHKPSGKDPECLLED